MTRQYLVINRFADPDADYGRYLGTDEAMVMVITTPDAASWVTQDARFSLRIVDRLDEAEVLPIIYELNEAGYTCDGVAALSEHDIVLAAKVRSILRAPGYSIGLAASFKDKCVMKEIVQSAGVRVPRFVRVTPELTEPEVAAAVGYPVVWKPTSSAGSLGVEILGSADEVQERLRGAEANKFECEEYISDRLFHIDGVVREGLHIFCQVSEYIGTPLAYLRGQPVGSYTVEAPEVRQLTIRAIDALGLVDGVYHLEIMRSSDGSLVFLEVGMRPGGSEIVAVARENHGIDLFEETFRSAVGLPSRFIGAAAPTSPHVGWVIYPSPIPDQAAHVTALSLKSRIPEIYSESLCDPDEMILPGAGYTAGPAQYRLRATEPAQLISAIESIIKEQPVSGIPVVRIPLKEPNPQHAATSED